MRMSGGNGRKLAERRPNLIAVSLFTVGSLTLNIHRQSRRAALAVGP